MPVPPHQLTVSWPRDQAAGLRLTLKIPGMRASRLAPGAPRSSRPLVPCLCGSGHAQAAACQEITKPR